MTLSLVPVPPTTLFKLAHKAVAASLLFGASFGMLCPLSAGAQTGGSQPASAAAAAVAAPSGTPLSPAALTALLPPSVYFRGKSAPLQLRNAGAVRFGPDATVWAALVDTSGYASDVQEKYQFYLVTEAPLTIAGVKLPAGAYGAGFLGERFLVMDLGGHTVAEGPLQTDAAFKRPRPLQMLPDTAHSVKLYLGRHWVALTAASS